MAYRTPEYRHLLAAERVLSKCLERPDIEPRDAAMVASALTRTVDQKRVMRGQPAPKPADAKPKSYKPKVAKPVANIVQAPVREEPPAQAQS